MTERANPLDDAEPVLDLSKFKPQAKRVPAEARAEVHQVSEANGFPDRQTKPRRKKKKVQRRRLTGRNVQLNIKAKQETIDLINAIADRRGWVLGEVLEHALAALEA